MMGPKAKLLEIVWRSFFLLTLSLYNLFLGLFLGCFVGGCSKLPITSSELIQSGGMVPQSQIASQEAQLRWPHDGHGVEPINRDDPPGQCSWASWLAIWLWGTVPPGCISSEEVGSTPWPWALSCWMGKLE